MNPKSASTLIWLAVILIFLGFVSPNPALPLFLFVLASISAAIPAILARKQLRITGIITLLVSITLAVNSYPAYKKHMDTYAERIKKHTPASP